MPDPELSVVVATHNRADRLRALLGALRDQTLARTAFEVVVVDDASTDDTAGTLAAEVERGDLEISVYRHPDNRGSGAARELGWRSARGRLIAFTDDDCVPDPDWLERIVRAERNHPGAVIQGRTEPIPGELEGLPPRRRAFARTIRVVAFDAGFQTCNIVYPRELLERIGGFDVAEYPRYPGEDCDLGWRAVEAGAPAIYADDVRVRHAVNDLGPTGKLRHAASWDMKVYARLPQLRRAHFYRYGLFWKRTHFFLAIAAVGLLLPRRFWILRALLALRYGRTLYGRAMAEGSGLAMIPYYLVYDLTEVATVVRGAIRYRTPMF